ncbi:hypothetical protein K470DRAFT_243810 [Piedraia hortae CBS 480.64]|uniref:Phosphatidate phosphatase APP1 catalytic domain-containing protein n=1 Tax=Piedraia hortae CBS 480.64 TaxID=1314780 RepID=A0A6A7C3Z6_9PEZI|nr:hypothetical protein K470DRAFT_243810 [Piedraia hortae CBS 480.64]
MTFLYDVLQQGRRAVVQALNGASIEHDAPFSPDVPDDLREWLPDLFDRFPVVLPWARAEPVDPALHNVWIFDNTAFRTPQAGDHRPDLAKLANPQTTQPTSNGKPTRGGSGWEVEFVAAYFVKDSQNDLSQAVAKLVKALNIGREDIATKKLIASRLEPFASKILAHRTLRISIASMEEQTLGPSSLAGVSSELHELHIQPPDNKTVQSTPLDLPPPFGMSSTTVFAGETGWGLISDIDDTIKVTGSNDPVSVLHTTFAVAEPEPVTGMPELYAHISKTLRNPATFYLSASPYPLYPFLRDFERAHYPQGTIILRDASWQNLGGLVASLQEGVEKYKVDRLVKIHAWLPHRRFVCVGDSLQSDPEAYGEAARRFPGWIRAIFIRRVGTNAEKVKQERFEEAFRGLDRRLWHVFTDAGELSERIDELGRDDEALVGGEHFG